MQPSSTYQLTPEERGFLKALHLEDFITLVSWRVLHPKLVTKAIAPLDPRTLTTTVKGESVPLISKKWRKQFQHVFHLTLKEA